MLYVIPDDSYSISYVAKVKLEMNWLRFLFPLVQ
jgi:hypothetical protein